MGIDVTKIAASIARKFINQIKQTTNNDEEAIAVAKQALTFIDDPKSLEAYLNPPVAKPDPVEPTTDPVKEEDASDGVGLGELHPEALLNAMRESGTDVEYIETPTEDLPSGITKMPYTTPELADEFQAWLAVDGEFIGYLQSDTAFVLSTFDPDTATPEENGSNES